MAALICRSFKSRTIAFFETKKDAHRFTLLLTLLGVKVSELHGDISQALRYDALEKFKTGQNEVLVATDVAARGLDIPGVQTVINAEMPRNASTYVHRVGRTARAGCGGRAVTLVTDARRKVMKDVLKEEGDVLTKDGGQVLSRTIPPPVITHYFTKIAGLEEDLDRLSKEERMKAKIDRLDQDAERAENLLLHQDEIHARPARTWYQTETQKKEIRATSKAKAEEEIKAAAIVKPLTAQEASNLMLRRDDYKVDEKSKSKDHKLSRKKRRRQEAMKELEEDKQTVTIQSAPKKAKVAQREIKKESSELIAGNVGLNRKIKTAEGKTKILRQKFVAGGLDPDLFDLEGHSAGVGGGGMNKKQRMIAAKESQFTEFDANKVLRKGGKVGKNSFKSKKKFKRR